MPAKTLLTAAAFLLTLPCVLRAQETNIYVPGTDGVGAQGIGPEGYGGFADLMRAYGEMVLNGAQAAEHCEAAREQGIANDAEAVRQWWARHDAYQARQSRENTARRREHQQKAVRTRATTKSRSNVAASVTANGQIQWPAALLADAHNESRQHLQRSFRYGDQASTAKSVDTLAGELRSRIHELSSSEYMQAQSFLKNLKKGPAAEAPHPVRTVNRAVHRAVGVNSREG